MKDSDDVLWLKLDGSLFNLSVDVFLCLVYNVPEGSSRQGLLDNINLFDGLSDHMVHINNLTNNRCQFLVCGDFNARTSDFPDYVQDDNEDHIHVLPDDYSTDTPLKRVSEDRGFNRYGSELLDFCKQTGLRILNGRAGVDGNVGKCTYVGSSGRSLVDYVIASQQIFSLIDTFVVSDPNILTDHCAVNFSLCSYANDENSNTESDTESSVKYKYVWNNEYVESYQNALESDNVRLEFQELKSKLLTEDVDINANLSSFQNTMETVCTPLFKKNLVKQNNVFSMSESNQPWYNEDCKLKRNVFTTVSVSIVLINRMPLAEKTWYKLDLSTRRC